MSSGVRPFTIKDSSDYTNQIRRRLVSNDITQNKTLTPLTFRQSFEIKYDNFLTDCNVCSCTAPSVPQPDYANSTQQFGSFLGNTYLTNIKVSWFPVECVSSYYVRLIEYTSDSTLVESDELKTAPDNSFVQIGGLYYVQYSFQSNPIGPKIITWTKTYTPQSRVAKVFAFVFAEFNGILNVNDGKSIRYSVFDVAPLIPLTIPPTLSFDRSTATLSGSNVSTFKIEWDPLPNAYCYRVFLVEGSGTLYVQSQTKNTSSPQKYDNTGNLFTFTSNDIFITEFERVYNTPSYTTVTAFVIAYDASLTPSFYPYQCLTISGHTMTLNRTLSSPDGGIRFYLNSNSDVSTTISLTLPLPVLQTKTV